MFAVIAALVLGALLYYYLFHYGYDYFDKIGVKSPKVYPFFGNLWNVWKKLLFEWELENYRQFDKIYGIYEGKVPNLFISDPEIIKQILVKDFESFTNRREFPIEEPYMRRLLSIIRDEDWKNVRSAVTPVFTSGKIKRMVPLINECADTLLNRMAETYEKSGKADMKQYFGAFTMDVISTCVFGMKIDSLADPNNPFIISAQKIFSPPEATSPMFLLIFILPWLFKLLRMKMLKEKEKKIFFDPLIELFKNRRENPGQKRNDYIDLMIEAMDEEKNANNEGSAHVLDDETVLAQAFLFLVAGFDTTATTLTMMSHCLATNPDVQENLYKEIREKLEEHGEVNHDMVNDMPYLEQCINETLRVYPPAVRTERQAGKDMVLGGVPVEKGLIVSIPVYGLHHDPQYYPDPEKYDPDRFSPEEKAKRNPYVYLPFGLGPRNCIGMRFAQEEMKIGMCRLLQKYRLTVCEETKDPPEFGRGFVSLIQPRKIIVGLEQRLE